MARKSQAVVRSETGSAIPSYLKSMEGRPATLDDNFDADDITLPRVALLQGTSDICKEFADAQPGMFWHTGLDRAVDPMRFVICSRRKRVLLSAPLDDGRGVLARAEDALTWDRTGEWTVVLDRKTRRTAVWTILDLNVARSGLLKWGTADPEFPQSPPAATLFYEYAVLFPDEPELGMAVVSLARSAIKRAKQGLNDKIALHASNGRPMQSLVFEAKATVETNDFGDFYNWRFTGAGFAPEEVYERAVMNAALAANYRLADEDRLGSDFADGAGASPSPASGTGGAAPSHASGPDDDIPF